MPVGIGALGYTRILEHLSSPIVCELLVEHLIVSEASRVVLLVDADEGIELLGQKPEVVTLGLRDALWGSGFVLERSVLDLVVVVLNGLVHYDIGSFDGPATSVEYESNRCDIEQQS